jgi:Na+/melibiose symporter-like transporter
MPLVTHNPPLDPSKLTDSENRGRHWSIGTLSYTIGGLVFLFIWLLLGDFVLNMKERAINPIALVMLRGFSASDWVVGLLVGSIPSAIGLLLVPYVSVKSDQYRSRWGRRIPFVLLPTPFIVLTMLGLAIAPRLGDWVHHAIGMAAAFSAPVCRTAVFALFWTGLEIASIIANSIFGALLNDVVPHQVIGRFFALFRAVGLIAGILFYYWLMGETQAHHGVMLISLAALYLVGISVMCFVVKEGEYPPPQSAGPDSLHHGSFLRPLIAYLKECYGNPFFLSFFLATTLGGVALAPVNTFAVYHARSVNMSDTLYGHCVALSYCVSLVLAYPLGILADRFHPLRIGIITMAAYALVTAWGFFFAVTASNFFIALALHTVISGSFITATASIAQRLLPRAKFAEIVSAGGILGACIGLIVPPSLGIFIARMNHDYRYVFLLASIIAMLTCASYAVLLRQYNIRGGDRGYLPPQ